MSKLNITKSNVSDAIISLTAVTDSQIRKLIKLADDEKLPLAGRTIRLPLYISDIYGHTLVFDSSIKKPAIDGVIKKRVELSSY